MNDFTIELSYHITDRCNLKCAGCNNFCPLVPNTVKDKHINQIKADLLLMSKFRDCVKLLAIMGGEPTLHKDLAEILRFARSLFPKSKITLPTNCVLQDKLINLKDVIIENDIQVVGTIYPYTDNYMDIYNNLQSIFQDHIVFYQNAEKFQIQQFSNKLLSTSDEAIQHCRMRNVCMQLKDGKLYICNSAANMNYLKSYFKDNCHIQMDGTEYVDLNTCTYEDIQDLSDNRVPLVCKYCNEANRHFFPDDFIYTDWHVSEKDRDEWITPEKN